MLRKAFCSLTILGLALAAGAFYRMGNDSSLQQRNNTQGGGRGRSYQEFLGETEHLDFRHPIFTTVLRRVTSEAMSVGQKLEALFYIVRDGIPFDPSASGQRASDYLIQSKAICYHKAMIFVCFCRLLGIPARVAEEHFVIRENPKYPDQPNAHGIASIFFRGRWVYLDTVSNREAWRWWVTTGAESFEPPKFTLKKNAIVGSAFLSSITFTDFETNDVPLHWMDSHLP